MLVYDYVKIYIFLSHIRLRVKMSLASKRYRDRHRDHYLKLSKDYYRKNKKRLALKQQEREKMKSKAIHNWYSKVVTGYLDYHFGSERWDIKNNKEKY